MQTAFPFFQPSFSSYDIWLLKVLYVYWIPLKYPFQMLQRNVELKNKHQTNKTHSLLQSGWSQINMMSNLINSLTMYIPRRGEADMLGVRCKTRIQKKVSSLPNLLVSHMAFKYLSTWMLLFKFLLGRLLLWFSFHLKRNLNSQRMGSSFCCVDLIIIILKLTYSASFPTGCEVPSSPDNTCRYPKLTEEWTQDQTQNLKWSGVHAGLAGVPKGTLSGRTVGYTGPRQEMWGVENRIQNLS